MSVQDNKGYLEECENRYRESFKKDSCQEILASYRALQSAKKDYYASLGQKFPQEDNFVDQEE